MDITPTRRARHPRKYPIFRVIVGSKIRTFADVIEATRAVASWLVRDDRYQVIEAMAREVRGLLVSRNPKTLNIKPNPYEPTAAQSVALALLELDRLASEPLIDSDKVPPFASDFLKRRLSRRLLDRYNTAELAAELDRRLSSALERLANGSPAGARDQGLERIHRLVADLHSALLQRTGPRHKA